MEPSVRNFTMLYPTTMFGCGMLKQLHNQPMPGKKALIIISKGKTAYLNGKLDTLKNELDLSGVEYAIFDKVQENPTNHNVDDGVAFCRDNECDFVVALGGGSVMDCAKGISLMFFQDHDYWYYVDHSNEIIKQWLPVITITTDAGTGSESDPFICVSNEELCVKVGLPNTKLIGTFPVLAIVDPELAVTVPTNYTAFQGYDAFCHSAECFVGNKSNYMSDMYGIKSIELVAKYLPRAVADGADIEAREKISLANNLSSMCMFVGATIGEHSLEHGIGAYHPNVPHGAGLLMYTKAYFKRYIEAHVCDDRFIKMAQVMGIEDADRPEQFLEALEDLLTKCGVNDVKMSDYGIKREEIPIMVHNAKTTNAGLFNNDRINMTEEVCIAILEESYK